MLFTDEITPEMRALPQKRFIIMAFLDCLGTFLTAMGAVYTPGEWISCQCYWRAAPLHLNPTLQNRGG